MKLQRLRPALRRTLPGRVAGGIVTWLFAAPLLAAEGARFAAPAATVIPESGGGMLRTFLALLLILALIFAASWLLKRLRVAPGGAGSGIQVLAQVSLGARERAVLVRVAGRELLLGVAPGNVRTLLQFGAAGEYEAARATPESPVPVTGNPPAGGATRPSFSELLRRSLGR